MCHGRLGHGNPFIIQSAGSPSGTTCWDGTVQNRQKRMIKSDQHSGLLPTKAFYRQRPFIGGGSRFNLPVRETIPATRPRSRETPGLITTCGDLIPSLSRALSLSLSLSQPTFLSIKKRHGRPIEITESSFHGGTGGGGKEVKPAREGM